MLQSLKSYREFIADLPDDVAETLRLTAARLASVQEDEFVNEELFIPATHLLGGVSKLVRPALVFIGAHMIGEMPGKFVDLALAAEMMHVSSLIHDDMIDGDKERRGLTAVHVMYGNDAAILAGDALISRAISLSAKYGEGVMSHISKAAMEMCAGELLDSANQRSGKVPSIEKYKEIARLKSASLIAACCSAPAVYKKNGKSEAIFEFGKDIGMAFQIKDDVDERIGGDGMQISNIVSSIRAELLLDEKEACLKAIEMNNEYVESALSKIRELGYAAMEKYAESIRIRE